ncbi:MAG TPA: hypothetical protein VIY48_11800 [Candidatus Paceibacterota bacterium]
MSEEIKHLRAEVAKWKNHSVTHSIFSYPHFWLWHALFDGTWLCRCWHSKEMKDLLAIYPPGHLNNE